MIAWLKMNFPAKPVAAAVNAADAACIAASFPQNSSTILPTLIHYLYFFLSLVIPEK
jgi:hypothetical protein